MGLNFSPAKIVTDGLIFHFDAANPKSYVSGNAICNDMSATQSIGTLNNGTSFNTADGGSFVFDGVDDYIQTNFDEFASPPFTVEIWFKTTNDNQIAGVFSSRLGSSNSYRQFSMFIAGDQYGATAGNKLACYHGSNPGVRANNVSTTNVCDGKWHQGIVISDAGNSYNYIYIDGVYEDQSDFATINMTENPDYIIGAFGDAGSYSNPFDGSIANIKYYNRQLSGAEILQNYNTLKFRFI